MLTHRLPRLCLRPIILLAALLGAGCNGTSPGSGTAPSEPALAAGPSGVTSQSIPIPLLEALDSVEMGKNQKTARHELEQAIADTTLSSELRDRSTLALAKLTHSEGDHESAIRRVEQLMEAHANERHRTFADQSEEVLRRLITGQDRSTPNVSDPASPSSQALATMTKGLTSRQRLRVVIFGGKVARSTSLGTFNVAEYAQDASGKSPKLDYWVTPSWTQIPTIRRELTDSLVAIFLHLDGGWTPERYSDIFAADPQKVRSELEQGHGVYAVKKREGAPPLVLLGAPRLAQLEEVERVFSQVSELDADVHRVPLTPSLRSSEIQSAIRGRFGGIRACYEQLRKVHSTAAGKLTLRFSIQPSGATTNQRLEPAGTLDDPTFLTCAGDWLQRTTFPATTSKTETTVVYPILFSP